MNEALSTSAYPHVFDGLGSRPLSPALMNANRPNPQKSTCPRIAPRKAQPRVIHGLAQTSRCEVCDFAARAVSVAYDRASPGDRRSLDGDVHQPAISPGGGLAKRLFFVRTKPLSL